MIILRTDDGVIDAPMWGLRYMRLTDQLSVTNFLRLEGNRGSMPSRRRRVFELLVDRLGHLARSRELER